MKVKDSEEVGLKFNIQKTKIMVSGPISSWQIDGETMELLEIKGNKNEVTDFNLWAPKSLWMMTTAMKLRHLLLGRNAMTNLDSTLLCRQRTSTQSYGFSSSHVWMWELDYKESWVPKNWCFWAVVLEKTLDSPLDRKDIKPINPKGNQSQIFIGRADAEVQAPILWPPDAKNWLIGKDPDAEKDWRQEKGTTEDEMVGWHHRLNGHEFEQALGVGDGQGSLACCSPWVAKSRPRLSNWTEPNWALKRRITVTVHNILMIPGVCSKAKERKKHREKRKHSIEDC